MRPLQGVVKDYAWGSTTAIPEILGTEPDGRPVAEYWLGAHPAGPARVGGTTLDHLVEASPAVLGTSTAARFGGKLPYLIKILAAESPLSLQAHPSADQARKGFDAEQAQGIPLDDPTRTFKDTWPKPELLVALGPFEALSGFQDPQITVRLFDALGSKEPIERLVGPLRHRRPEPALAEVFLECLCPDESHRAILNGVLSAALEHTGDRGPLGEFARLAVRLDEWRPGDPSILAALLLNHVRLARGQALHVPAGVLHAYVHGTGIEIMASSDNVVRGGLTPKHIDVKALVELLHFTPKAPEIIRAEQLGPGAYRYPTRDAQFALWRIEARPGREVSLPAAGTARILLLVEGHAELGSNTPGGPQELVQGQSAFLEAGERASVRGGCLAFMASPGDMG